MKICSRCKISKSIDSFHKSIASKDGHKPHCKGCVKLDSIAYYESNKDIFSEKNKKYYVANKERVDRLNKEWAKNNRDKVTEIHKKWVENNQEMNLFHKQKWLVANPEKRKESIRKYRLNNLSKHAEKNMRRYARKLNATPIWADIEAIKDVYKEAEYFQMQVDHIIPLMGKNVCGLHVLENLQLLSAENNRKKGNRFAI